MGLFSKPKRRVPKTRAGKLSKARKLMAQARKLRAKAKRRRY